MTLRSVLIFLLHAAGFASCKREPKPATTGDFRPGEHYFSLHQFALDQWKLNLQGRPLVFQRFAVINGRADSSYVALDTMRWSEVLPRFLAADISDPKYLGHYRYSEFDEPMLSTKTLLYEALEPDLHTRSLQLNVDGFSGRVESLLIKTRDRADAREQTLLYVPNRLIQVLEHGAQGGNEARNLQIEYRLETEEGEPGVMMGSAGVDSLVR